MKELRKSNALLKKFIPDVKMRHGVRYIPSQFLVSYELNGKGYIYNTLTQQCIESELPESAKAGDGFDELIKDMFLVPESKNEFEFYQSVSTLVRAYNHKKGIRAFTILPTFGCNARCVYCYEEGMKPITMAADTVEQTVRYIVENKCEGKICLSWFGGEPLICVSIIDHICEKLRKCGVDYESTMTSNGSLINDAIINKMTEVWNLKSIQISMDGTEDAYKSRKCYYSYDDTYHRVIHAVQKMSKAGIKVSVRCNVDMQNISDIDIFLQDLDKEITHKDNVTVYFCPLNDVRLGSENLKIWSAILKMRAKIQMLGFGILVGSGIGTGLRTSHCMADSGNVVIAPDGSLYPCEHCPPESCFGDIFRGVTDQKAKDNFCRIDAVREKCRTCPYLPECTGFSNCPIQDSACRDVRYMFERDYLKMLIEKNSSDHVLDHETETIC